MNAKAQVLFIWMLFAVVTTYAQKDSSIRYGVIKVGSHKDSTYVLALTDFKIIRNIQKDAYVYHDFAMRESMNPSTGGRVTVKEAHPLTEENGSFDYTAYFTRQAFYHKIKLRAGERDTVQLLIFVDKDGQVEFTDVKKPQIINKDTVYFDGANRAYKKDVCHHKTHLAFDELTLVRWVPSEIRELKKHPSRHRKAYKTTPGCMEGILMVVYSSDPIE